ncbi:hypothetical protein J4G02_20865 [Candidatus Poribacteria bacterium]|nr:hypothetical protein [Candidatus Poribacteria bacterium]
MAEKRPEVEFGIGAFWVEQRYVLTKTTRHQYLQITIAIPFNFALPLTA